MRTLFLSLVTVAALAAASTPEQSEREFGKALSSNDMATLDKLVSVDLVYTHSTGNTDSKDTYLGSLKSGDQKYNVFEYGKIEQKMYGNTALVFADVHVKSVTKGTPGESHLKILHVWVKKGSAWQLVAHQSTKLPS